jgi:hypothetical protein
LHAEQLTIVLAGKHEEDVASPVLHVPWKKRERREILLPSSATQDRRPIRSETRVALVSAIARGRHWLEELIAGTITDVEQITTREGCSLRHAYMTISLAFVSPALVRAAIEGRLPRGIGIARLRNAPAEWSCQHAMLGLSFNNC